MGPSSGIVLPIFSYRGATNLVTKFFWEIRASVSFRTQCADTCVAVCVCVDVRACVRVSASQERPSSEIKKTYLKGRRQAQSDSRAARSGERGKSRAANTTRAERRLG